MQRIKTNKKDIIWNYIGTFFSMGINYLLLPIFLYYLEDDILALWYIFMNLSNFSLLFNFGFSPSFSRNIAYVWSGATKLSKQGKVQSVGNDNEFDENVFWNVLSACRTTFLIVSALATLCIAAFGTPYISHIAGDVIDDPAFLLSWWILVVAIFLNLYFGYYLALLSGIGKIAERNQAQVIASIIRIVLTFVLLFCSTGILGATLAYLIYGFVFRALSRSYFLKSIEHFQNNKHPGSSWKTKLHYVRIVWHNAWRDGLVSLSEYLSSQAGTIICSMFLPLSVTGVYSVTVQLAIGIGKIARSYQIAMIPELQASYITGNEKKQKELLSKSMVVVYAIFMVLYIAMIILGIQIIMFIRQGFAISRVVFSACALLQIMIVSRNCYASFLSTTNNLDYWRAFIISAVCSVGLMIIIFMTVNDVGVWGMIIPSIICEGCFNVWYWRQRVLKLLQMNSLDIILIAIKSIRSDLNKKLEV